MEDAKPGGGPGSGAWLAGLVSAGLGLAAHLAAGGPAPSLMILAALTALLGMAAAMLGRLSLPGWALLLACALAQQLLHLGFSAFSGGAGGGLSGHGHGGVAPTPSPAGEVAPPAGYSLHLMLHLHMAAALATCAAINYWPRLTGWSGRVAFSSQRSTAA